MIVPTETPLPAHRGRRWLPFAAIVGAVVLLATAAGIVAATFFLANRTSAIGSAAAYVPSGAPLYVEIRLEPSTAQDASLRELLGRFPAIEGLDLDRPLAEQLAELLDDGLAEQGLDVSWSDDVRPWTDGRLAIALLDLPPSLFDPTADPAHGDVLPVVAILGVTDPDAARDAVARILDAAGAPRATTSEHRGVTIHATGDEGAYAVTDEQLLMAASPDDVMTALDSAAGDANLAGREDLAAHAARLPDDWLAFGTLDLTDALGAAIDTSVATDDPSAELLARILEHQPMTATFAIAATGDGLAYEAAIQPPTGPFAVQNANRGFAAEVPADALYFAEGGNLGVVLVELVAAAKASADADPLIADQLATAEAAVGADLEEFVSWIGDGALVVGWGEAGPYGGLVLEAADRDAAERRLAQLVSFARLAGMDPATGLTVEESEVDGTTVTTIAWAADPAEVGPMPVAGVSVQLATTGERVLIGLGDAFVGRVLGIHADDSLAAEPRYADAVASLGGPNAAGVVWVDLAAAIERTESVLSDLGAPVSDAGPVLEWLAPLDRVVAVARLDDDVLVQRSVVLVR